MTSSQLDPGTAFLIMVERRLPFEMMRNDIVRTTCLACPWWQELVCHHLIHQPCWCMVSGSLFTWLSAHRDKNDIGRRLLKASKVRYTPMFSSWPWSLHGLGSSPSTLFVKYVTISEAECSLIGVDAGLSSVPSRRHRVRSMMSYWFLLPSRLQHDDSSKCIVAHELKKRFVTGVRGAVICSSRNIYSNLYSTTVACPEACPEAYSEACPEACPRRA